MVSPCLFTLFLPLLRRLLPGNATCRCDYLSQYYLDCPLISFPNSHLLDPSSTTRRNTTMLITRSIMNPLGSIED